MRVIHSTLAPKQKATAQVVLAVTTSVTSICALIALTCAALVAVTGIVARCFEVLRERSMQSATLSTQADLAVARPLRPERRVIA
jgi:hypothetical protein